MTTPFESNFVYLAQGLTRGKYQAAGKALLHALQAAGVAHARIPLTLSPKHIWTRDYMPIQVRRDQYVLFHYKPDYLNKYPDYIPPVNDILEHMGIEVLQSDIVLDGGNLISCGGQVILTNKIFKENPSFSQTKLLDELGRLLEAEPVLIPWDMEEIFGHADGMVRYLGNKRVIINHYCDFDPLLGRQVRNRLQSHFQVEELAFGGESRHSWAYLNYLQVGRRIFVPMVGERYDAQALEQIQALLPDCQCLPVADCQSLVSEGGALNCSSWNVQS